MIFKKKVMLLGVLAMLSMSMPVASEPVTLICVPDDARQQWRAQVDFDLEEWTLSWGSEAWELTGGDERALAARALNGEWPMSLVIDRETGKFWRAHMGRFCIAHDCKTSRLDAFIETGRCTRRF